MFSLSLPLRRQGVCTLNEAKSCDGVYFVWEGGRVSEDSETKEHSGSGLFFFAVRLVLVCRSGSKQQQQLEAVVVIVSLIDVGSR